MSTLLGEVQILIKLGGKVQTNFGHLLDNKDQLIRVLGSKYLDKHREVMAKP